MSPSVRFLPLVLVALVVAAMVWRLANPPDPIVHSRLVGQPVPQFALPAAVPGKPPLSSADLASRKTRLLNIFASWCVPCVAEAPILAQLHKAGVEIDGIAIRDRPADVAAFLARNGDPSGRVGADNDSRVQLALGASGVPETFVIDRAGIIRLHHVGPIEAEDVPVILAEVEKWR
jgi:cytochrome c biogenesis protein CcmG, thiol:disulfide interchange protein DsbE